MQSLMILFVCSVMLKTISSSEVSVKRTKFLHFACWFELPNKMVFYTDLCFKQRETAIWVQFNSHVTLATVSSWLRTTLWTKSPIRSQLRVPVSGKGTTKDSRELSREPPHWHNTAHCLCKVVGLTCNHSLAWPRLLRNGSTWLQLWHSLKCKMLMER